jgi:hypothetical protein
MYDRGMDAEKHGMVITQLPIWTRRRRPPADCADRRRAILRAWNGLEDSALP